MTRTYLLSAAPSQLKNEPDPQEEKLITEQQQLAHEEKARRARDQLELANPKSRMPDQQRVYALCAAVDAASSTGLPTAVAKSSSTRHTHQQHSMQLWRPAEMPRKHRDTFKVTELRIRAIAQLHIVDHTLQNRCHREKSLPFFVKKMNPSCLVTMRFVFAKWGDNFCI